MKVSSSVSTLLLLSTPFADAFVPAWTRGTQQRTHRAGITTFPHSMTSSISAPTTTTTTKSEVGISADEGGKKKENINDDATIVSPLFPSHPLPPNFAAVRDDVLTALQSNIESKSVMLPLIHFVNEYFTACADSYNAGNTNVTPGVAATTILNAVEYGMVHGMGADKFIFGVRHRGMRGIDPDGESGNKIDFYQFGNDFFRNAIDLQNSIVLGKDNLNKAFEQINNGENVVFLANHQSEADPQVMSILLESIQRSDEASHVTYVAGHKVTTDALAIPFSMGRNLLCIHSKKHIDADPTTKPHKQKQNLAAMSAMLEMMKRGGASLWVAPSGGRDRRDVDTGLVPLAPFDQKTVDMFRLMGNKSKKLTHFYPLAMVSYELCPPPDHVEAGVGEQRNVRFTPIGIHCCEEVDNVGGVESRHLFTEKAMKACTDGYEELLQVMQKEKQKKNENEQEEEEEGDESSSR